MGTSTWRGVRPAATLALVLLLGACGGAPAAEPPPTGAVAAALERVEEIQVALDRWRDAPGVAEAHRAAETVSNLTTGPGVERFGDLDDDGSVAGSVATGLLPGQDGETSLGLVLAGCAGPDLLGGSWSDPAARWSELLTRIETWTPRDNRFPELTSHALRTVGWARLTLGSDRLTDAQEYAGHAQLHVDATRAAVEACPGR